MNRANMLPAGSSLVAVLVILPGCFSLTGSIREEVRPVSRVVSSENLSVDLPEKQEIQLRQSLEGSVLRIQATALDYCEIQRLDTISTIQVTERTLPAWHWWLAGGAVVGGIGGGLLWNSGQAAVDQGEKVPIADPRTEQDMDNGLAYRLAGQILVGAAALALLSESIDGVRSLDSEQPLPDRQVVGARRMTQCRQVPAQGVELTVQSRASGAGASRSTRTGADGRAAVDLAPAALGAVLTGTTLVVSCPRCAPQEVPLPEDLMLAHLLARGQADELEGWLTAHVGHPAEPRVRAACHDALSTAADQAMAVGNHAEAIPLLKRCLALEPEPAACNGQALRGAQGLMGSMERAIADGEADAAIRTATTLKSWTTQLEGVVVGLAELDAKREAVQVRQAKTTLAAAQRGRASGSGEESTGLLERAASWAEGTAEESVLVDSIEFEKASAAGSEEAYQAYLENHPEGAHREEASRLQEEARALAEARGSFEDLASQGDEIVKAFAIMKFFVVSGSGYQARQLARSLYLSKNRFCAARKRLVASTGEKPWSSLARTHCEEAYPLSEDAWDEGYGPSPAPGDCRTVFFGCK